MMGDANPTLRLSAQRALLGAIGPEVLGVCVGLENGRLAFSGFVSERATEDEREALDFAATEIIADFSEATALDVEIAALDGTTLPERAGEWVFIRMGAAVRRATDGGSSK
jgi:hypothetical protein